MCVFDITMLLNLISNRSYTDLHQYPIFPTLYFYDNDNLLVRRDLKEHIGLNEVTESQKERKVLFYIAYQENFHDIQENDEFSEDFDNRSHLFTTHYSNIVYIQFSNLLVTSLYNFNTSVSGLFSKSFFCDIWSDNRDMVYDW